ncbi:hypothetical protein BX666DRAFT_1941144 [Dichotomocladium elegans]|nr:hypothetical protein BX666DRAFT_1941144 [Dichotomocladium elegans]
MRSIKFLLAGLFTVLILASLAYHFDLGRNWRNGRFQQQQQQERQQQGEQQIVVQPPSSGFMDDTSPAAGLRRTAGSAEKYLTFYPHSGLHNQRLGLVNALVLARALNRTLLLPELNLGKGAHWAASPLLARRMGTCVDIPVPKRKGECYDYRRYIPLPASQVFDLAALDGLGIRWIERTDMHPSYLDDAFSREEIYALNDTTRFSYRIYDMRNNTRDLLQFEYRVDLEDLVLRDEPLMVFGSLFSTFRLVLDNRPDLRWLRDYLSGELGFNNPTVLRQALDVAAKLGGPGAFASVHLRTGDGVFRVVMDDTMTRMRQTLQTLLSDTAANAPDHHQDVDRINALSSNSTRQQHNGVPITSRLQECLLAQKHPQNGKRRSTHPRLQMIFMATDAPEPRRTLPDLFDEFVCMFTLSDFQESIDQTILSSQRYGVLFLPLIDAEIATYGEVFVGTPRSTFSKYIESRNRRFLAYYPAIGSSS